MLSESVTMAINIDKEDKNLTVSFDYSPERISKIKTLSGYKWGSLRKLWTVPDTAQNLKALKRLYKNERIDIRFVHDSENEILIKKMDDQLKLKGYSVKPLKFYEGHMNRFASFTNKDISAAGPQEIRNYILFLLDEQ